MLASHVTWVPTRDLGSPSLWGDSPHSVVVGGESLGQKIWEDQDKKEKEQGREAKEGWPHLPGAGKEGDGACSLLGCLHHLFQGDTDMVRLSDWKVRAVVERGRALRRGSSEGILQPAPPPCPQGAQARNWWEAQRKEVGF